MIKMRILSFCLALMCLIGTMFCPAEAQNGDFLYMINVGKGDAIVICQDGRYYLIDTGKAAAWDKVESVLERFGATELQAVFLTHTDKDHSGGLKKLSKSGIGIKNLYASAFYNCTYDDHPMIKAFEKKDAGVTFLNVGDTVDDLFTVIGPIERDPSNEDNNSLVLMFDNGTVRVLLAGDMEGREERSLLSAKTDFTCDIFKVPNHADDDVCLYMKLDSMGARLALVSTDPYEKPGTPDQALLKRLNNAGMEVYRTDLSTLGVRVGLDGNYAVDVE